jgi:serine protease
VSKSSRRTRPQSPAADREATVESISLIVTPGPRRPAPLAPAAVRRLRLTGWQLQRVTEDGTEVELVPPRRVSPQRAWDLTYDLRDLPEVVHAEPLFEYAVPENAPAPAPKTSLRGRAHDQAVAADYEWSLRVAKVQDAWRLFGRRQPGRGIVVGHPDTGYTDHPEIADPARLLVSSGYDFDDEDPDPYDDLTAGFLDNPGHGTGTSSVIMSGVGPPAGGAAPFVSGAAPYASLIPIRTTESVVLFSTRGLRRAIDLAVDRRAHVVSISLGAPLRVRSLERAVARAVNAGVIVLAAAGNEVRFVVFPAAFDDVIAVAACNVHDAPWRGSSRGRAVDITAPGELVWRAEVEKLSRGGLVYRVAPGSGTSFAVATTAGVAALWLSYHGRQTLVRRFGAPNLARMFKQLLQTSCRTPPGWSAEDYGPGIVDAERLLSTPLPAVAPARKWYDARRPAIAADVTGIELLVHLLPELSRVEVESAVAGLLRVSDRDLPSVLQQFGDELAFHLVMTPRLRESLRRPRGAKAAPPRAIRQRLMRVGVSRRLRRQLQTRAL